LLIEALYETVYSFETTGGFEGGVFEAVGLVFWGSVLMGSSVYEFSTDKQE